MEAWLAQFENVQDTLPGDSIPWLREARQQAIANFSASGFPTLRDEAWKYTNVAPIKKRQFRLAKAQEISLTAADLAAFRFADLAAHEMVFVNGHFSAEHSSSVSLPGVELKNLNGWLSETDKSLDFKSPNDSNVFATLNNAFLSEGVVLRVDDNVVIEKPVHIIFVATETEEAVMAAPRVEIQLGTNSQVTVIESYVATGPTQNLTNVLTQITAGENSQLEHYRLQDESLQAYHVANIFIDQKRASRVICHSVSLGASLARVDINVDLVEPGAETVLNGLFMAKGRQLTDHHLLVDHLSPHTRSEQFFKGVLDDASRGVFNGKVIVHEDAQKIEAVQTNKNLLLSPDAEIDTKPELEIYADDVKCSHGATIGQLNDTELFYLRSRGIEEQKARALLIYAFADDVIERMRLLPIREYLEYKVVGQLSSLDDGSIEQNIVHSIEDIKGLE